MPYKDPDQRRASVRKAVYKFYAKRKAQGLCRQCGKPSRPGRIFCRLCGIRVYRKYNKRKGIH